MKQTKTIPKVNMSKQTALQWFLQELETKNGEYRGFNNLRITHGSLIEQALQMEREQIEKSYIKGREDWQKYGFSHYNYEKDMEIPTPRKYYEQTYGG